MSLNDDVALLLQVSGDERRAKLYNAAFGARTAYQKLMALGGSGAGSGTHLFHCKRIVQLIFLFYCKGICVFA